MKPLQTLAHCAREYPLLTMVGVYSALYTAGEFIARYIYEEPDYVFGDATALMLDSAEAGLLEFGNVSLVALRRLFGHDARDTAAFEHVIASFFRQAAVLLQRCLDRNIISVEEAEAAADSGDDVGDRVRLGISAAVLLSAAVRSADDAALANKARIVLASGDAVVSNDSVPAALQEALAMVLEAKKQLASPHHRTAEDRVRLCRDLVRAAIDGGSKASSPSDAYKHWTEDGGTGADALAGVLLRRAAAGLRKNLGERYDSAMDDVFVEVLEDRFGSFEDGGLSTHLVPPSDARLLARRPAHPGMWYNQ